MAPSTAIAFLLAGGALLASSRAFLAGSSLIILVFSSLKLIELWTGWPLELEHWFGHGRFGAAPLWRMAPLTAGLFVLAGAAGLALAASGRWKNGAHASGLLAAAILMSAVTLLLGYVYGTPLLYGSHVIPVALTTSLAFLTVGIGLIGAAGPSALPLRAFMGASTNARLLRAFLPVAVATVPIYEIISRVTGMYRNTNPALMAACSAILYGLAAGMLIWYVSRNIGTVIDRLEQELLRAQRLESIGALASGIAHDLNNVLQPILMAVPLLKNRLDDEQRAAVVAAVEDSATRGAGIVKQILGFAKGAKDEKAAIQLLHLITDMEKVFRETFPKTIQITVKVTKPLRTVMGSAVQLQQVLLNLCINARDAMPDGGALAITAENDGSHVVMAVADTGSGIPDELRDKIFDPFFTTKGPEKGTGLGLSTVARIIKHHGGAIRMESAVGQGTRFIVSLPAVDPLETQAPEEAARSLPAGHGETILLVDDEASVREMVKTTLHAYGYQVLVAENGVDAIAQYNAYPDRIQVVLTDLGMPIMDGRATIQVLRTLSPSLKIVAASGTATDGTIAPGQLGIQGFVTKPYTAEMLLTTLHDILHPSAVRSA